MKLSFGAYYMGMAKKKKISGQEAVLIFVVVVFILATVSPIVF